MRFEHGHTPGPWVLIPGQGGVYSEPLHRITQFEGKDFHKGLVALVYGEHDASGHYSQDANRALIAAGPEMRAVLDELEGAFDEQLYQERSREELDAPDDREYSVNITAKQLRAITRALSKAEHGS